MHNLVYQGRVLSDVEVEVFQLFQLPMPKLAPKYSFRMAADSGNTKPDSLPVSSLSTIGASPPSPCLNSIKTVDSASFGASGFYGSHDRIICLDPPLVKPDMIFARLRGSEMAAKLSAFLGSPVRTDTSIEATFARGRELDKLNKLVEIEEMNEKMKNSVEVKFKKEEDDEKKDLKSQVHVEMDILLGVVEEKKVPRDSNSAVLVGGDEEVHLRKSSEVPQVKGKSPSGGFDDNHGGNDMSAEGDMCKRKRGASDELEQSTAVGTKRIKIEEI